MSLPDGVRLLLTVMMCGVALFHLYRLMVRRSPGVDIDLTHLAIGLAMAAMLAGWLRPSAAGWSAAALAVPTLWFCGRGVHRYVMDGARPAVPALTQFAGCAAMVYMLAGLAAATASHSGMSMPTGPGPVTALTVVFVVAMLGVGAVEVRRLRLPVDLPGVAAGCQLAMSAATICMLVAG